MRVLVTFAVEAEFAPWRRWRRFTETRNGVCTTYCVHFDEVEVAVLLTGIGGKSAWLQGMKQLWNGHMDICISSGLAGALRTDYQIGQLVAAKKVNFRNWSIRADEVLLRAAVASGTTAVESFYTADHVVVAATEKKELGKVSDVVEMESGEVLHEAAGLGARVIAIRAISDVSEESLPLDFNRVTTESGEVSLSRVVAEIAKHPGAIPSLMRFGQHSKSAAEKLGLFLDRYLPALVGVAKQAVG
jgi:adenosylhomocysteine nucleosidase